jgi:hypothetical protein
MFWRSLPMLLISSGILVAAVWLAASAATNHATYLGSAAVATVAPAVFHPTSPNG